MTRSSGIIRILGIPMLLTGIVIAVFTALTAANPAGYIVDGLPAAAAICAGIHMLFMHGTHRPQGFMPAAFFMHAAGYALLLVSCIIIALSFTPEETWMSLGSIISTAVFGSGIYLFSGINQLTGNRMKISSVTAMVCAAGAAAYNAVISFSAISVLAFINNAGLLAYVALCPGAARTNTSSSRKPIIAAAVLFAAAALMHAADIIKYIADAGIEADIRVVCTYAAPLAASAFLMLYAFIPAVRERARLILPAGFLLMAVPYLMSVISSVIDGEFNIHYTSILIILSTSLCVVGCFFKKRAVWEAAAFIMACYVFAMLYQYTDWIITTILYFVNFTPADILVDVWHAAEVALIGIGMILFLAGARSDKMPALKFSLPVSQPSNIENDLYELRQRFDRGEITEEEYNTLRTERLERP